MAKLQDANPQNVSGGYERLFGIPELGLLMSKVQSTVISSGSELEKLIQSKVKIVDDLDSFLDQDIMPDDILLATKQQIKKCKTLNYGGSEPDFIIFKRKDGKQHCHIVELKDGHVFDTKKASAERRSLHRFAQHNAMRLRFTVSTHVCAFNQEDQHAIWDGLKRKINFEEVMTGHEFCNLLEIDYGEIVDFRNTEQTTNVRYFVSELLRIPQVRSLVKELLQSVNSGEG